MSKHNNVNPDHYKVGGRERPGKTADVRSKAQSNEQDERERWVGRSAARKSTTAGRGPEPPAQEPAEKENKEEEEP